MQYLKVFLLVVLVLVNVWADVKVQDVNDDFQALNIDLSDPNFDVKKAALNIKDAINKAAVDHEAKKANDKADTADKSDDGDEVAAAAAESGDIEIDHDVLVLTQGNFEKAVKDNPTILVEFYAPWCGHCKSLAPKYEEAAGMLKDADPPIKLAKVDATVHGDLGTKYGVTGYPSLKFFKNGVVTDYDGPREAHGIVEYMKERADPSWAPPPSKVVILTKDTFKDFIQNNDLSLVEFFAPWCGHCKSLAPIYEKAASQLAELDPPIPLATVDATEEKDLASEYGVSGYPTIKVFRKGRASDYKGERGDPEDFVSYMESQVGEGSKLKDTLKSVQETFLPDDIIVGAFFENDKDSLYQPYLDAANELRNDYTFFHTFSTEVRDKYKVNFGSVVVFNAERFYTDHENKWHVLEKPGTSKDDVVKFINDHKSPLVGELTRDTDNSRYKEKRPMCIFFYTVDFGFDHRKATQLWRRKIAKIAQNFREITFVIADEGSMNKKMKEFELAESNEDMNVGCYDKDGLRYRMEEFDEFDADDINEFMNKFKKGKLHPIIKSQKPPKKQDSGVITVVGKTFKDIVEDPSKDVLIEFYAPWCGHCKQLEPIYKELAEKVKSEKNLVIAKMDSTANDSPSKFNVKGFPTIYFSSGKDKENPLLFEGDRTLEGMEKFIKEKATVSFEGVKKDEL